MVHQADDVPPEALRFCQKSAPERGKTQRSTAGHLVLAARRAVPQLLLASQRIASGLPGTPNQASLLQPALGLVAAADAIDATHIVIAAASRAVRADDGDEGASDSLARLLADHYRHHGGAQVQVLSTQGTSNGALAVARVVGLNLEFNTWGVGLYRSVLAVRLLTVNTDLSPGSLLY